MTYRAITRDEAEDAIKLSALSFFYDPKDSLNELDRDKYHYEFIRGAFDDNGKMMAMLKLWPFEAWLDGEAVKMGGIGDVASLPEHRRGGHIRELFRLVFDEMHEQGYVLSYLQPFSHPYYRKFGYELCMKTKEIIAPLEPLLTFPQSGRAELFINGEEGTDPEPIITVYNTFAARHNLMLDRDGWWWERKLEKDPHHSKQRTYIWYDSEDKPAAYFTFNYKVDDPKVELEILDMAWVDDEALKGLLGFIGRFSGNVKTISFDCPPELVYQHVWPELRDVTVKIRPYGMARIINVRKALEVVKKPRANAAVTIEIEDDFAPWNTGCYKVEWVNGASQISKASAVAPDLSCSIEALTQMATGYLPLDAMGLRDDVEVNGKANVLRELFGKKNLFISDYF